MKFLIIGRPKSDSGSPFPPEAFKAASQYFTTKLSDGTLDCAYSFVPYGGMAIANEESAEKLWADIVSYPFFSGFDWEIEPLADIMFVLEQSAEG